MHGGDERLRLFAGVRTEIECPPIVDLALRRIDYVGIVRTPGARSAGTDVV